MSCINSKEWTWKRPNAQKPPLCWGLSCTNPDPLPKAVKQPAGVMGAAWRASRQSLLRGLRALNLHTAPASTWGLQTCSTTLSKPRGSPRVHLQGGPGASASSSVPAGACSLSAGGRGTRGCAAAEEVLLPALQPLHFLMASTADPLAPGLHPGPPWLLCPELIPCLGREQMG